jgi:curved DNA-binding protein
MQVSPDPRFNRKGNNLYTKHKIDLYTALMSGEVKIETMSGNVILKIPAGTQPGQTFKLSGKGMPFLKKKNKFGNLFVKVEVSIPGNLTEEQKELIERLKKTGI